MPFRLARSISLCPVQKESALPRDVPGFRRVFHMKEADPVRGLLIFQLREPEPAVDLKTAQLEKDKREEIVRVLCPGKWRIAGSVPGGMRSMASCPENVISRIF